MAFFCTHTPPFGHVYLVKHSMDNKTWSQFYATAARQTENQVHFTGCKVEYTYTDPLNGQIEKCGLSIPDMVLEQPRVKVMGYVVRRPKWFDISEAAARGICEQKTLNEMSFLEDESLLILGEGRA